MLLPETKHSLNIYQYSPDFVVYIKGYEIFGLRNRQFSAA